MDVYGCEWINGEDEWTEGTIGEELKSRLLKQLQTDLVPALCEYLRGLLLSKFSKNPFFLRKNIP